MGRRQGRTRDGGKMEGRGRKEGKEKGKRRVRFNPPRKNSGYGLGAERM